MKQEREDKKNKFLTSTFGILILAVIATFLWGSAYPSVKIGYHLFEISAEDIGGKLLFAGSRFFLAGILTLLAALMMGKRVLLHKEELLGIGILGIVQTSFQYIFFYIGLSNTTGVKGSILVGTGTFIAVILSHFFYQDDKLNLRKIIGCVIGFAGIVIINSGGAADSRFTITGEGFLILAAAAFAVGSLISKEVVRKSEAMAVTAYQLMFGGGILVIAGIAGGGRLDCITTSGTVLLLYLAFLSAAAFTIWTLLLKYNKVGKIAIFNCLVPVFGTILSAVFLKEKIMAFQSIIALVCVCVGIYFVNKQNCN